MCVHVCERAYVCVCMYVCPQCVQIRAEAADLTYVEHAVRVKVDEAALAHAAVERTHTRHTL